MVDREGAPLGRIAHIYLDRVTGEPKWALVAAGHGRAVFVPLADAAEQEHQIRVPVERALVSDAPVIRPVRQLSKEDTARLHGHYGGAPESGWASARRAPGGGPSVRLQRALDRARERAANPPAVGTSRDRLLLTAGAAVSSVIGGVVLARRRPRRQPSGLAAAVGRTVGSVIAVPAGALRRRRRRGRLRALVGAAAGPLAAAGQAVARAGGRVPIPPPTMPSRRSRSRRKRMAGNLKLLAGLAAGYVLGARAGRERYERIAEATRRLAGKRAEYGSGQVSLPEAAPAAGEDHAETRSQPPEAGGSGRDGGGSSPEPGPSSGRRERSRSGG
jgi:hypothetical protein